MRYLIVNADDFGMSQDVNRGILQTCREGVVTSASLMVHHAAARNAAAHAREIDLGLHIDLGEWVFADGQWFARYERARMDDAVAVEREIWRQLEMFEELVGCRPSHIDSHQHVHLREPALGAAERAARELGAPLRSIGNSIQYCGAFYGQSAKGAPCPAAVSVAGLTAILAELSPGVTELGCHPGADGELKSAYRHEREIELRTLCDPRVRRCIHDYGITLISFRDAAGLASAFRDRSKESMTFHGAKGRQVRLR
jgi:predicted glycoside hydrolase/deacetylase ChbG (UPF0249 family)